MSDNREPGLQTNSGADGINTVRLVRDECEPVEVLLPQITPRSVATLFSVRHIECIIIIIKYII